MQKITEKVEVEKVVCYKSVDGKEFTNEEECRKYEESAECVINANFNRHLIKKTDALALTGDGDEDDDIYILTIPDEIALNEINIYISFYMQSKWSKPNLEKCLLTDKCIGKTILLWTNYDQDYYWNYGTIDEYLDKIKNNYEKILNPPTDTDRKEG